MQVVVTADPAEVLAADPWWFPGQGAMPDCMRELDARGLRPAVLEAARNKPFLGICIGQQMLFEHSQEGDVPGLACSRAKCAAFPPTRWWRRRRAPEGAPHGLERGVAEAGPPLWAGIPDGARFYYVHSYYVDPADPAIVAATTDYGIPFTGAVAQANIFAVQFHPEKSAAAGLQLLSNFMSWKP
jgi:glutamine amidotransferase